MGRTVGDGYLVGGTQYRETSVVQAIYIYRDRKLITLYPLLEELP